MNVLIALPSYDGWYSYGTLGAILNVSRKVKPRYHIAGSSLLQHTFNVPFAAALENRGDKSITHFAMLHADIKPDPFWLDVLLDELQASEADVLSAVVPIKDDRGLSSTGLDLAGPLQMVRRLSMSEIQALPETFGASDCGHPGVPLLVNTGCWVARIREAPEAPPVPWADEFPGFRIDSAIEKKADGKRSCRIEPEDWNFSRYLHTAGALVLATRKLHLQHIGQQAFDNQQAWGQATDEEFAAWNQTHLQEA